MEIKQTDLEQKIVRFRQVLEDPRSDVLFSAAELYQILIKPVEADLKRINAETLLWSLDGVLRYVPFAALYDGEKFLVENYTNAVVTLSQPPENIVNSPKNWRALGAGVSLEIENLPALSQVPAELKAVVRDETVKTEKGLFAGKLLLNQDFTRENLIDSLKQKFKLVHFATHFVINPGKDVDSFLLFGDGGKLNLAEWRTVEAFDFSGADLLTLSACETALGTPNANGAEIESFGVIAQKRGAKTVIASLWSIADNSTPELMTEFYRQYKLGNSAISKAEALRKAQILMLKKAKTIRNHSHPAYWSPFIVLGDWR